MEEKFYHSDFEELIREKADQYKMYPSDKVWKGIDRSLRSRRRWYWTGFVMLLSGVSYFAITELMAPADLQTPATVTKPAAPATPVTASQLVPFVSGISRNSVSSEPSPDETVTSDLVVEDSGSITASFEIPLRFLPGNEGNLTQQKAAFLISGLEPLGLDEEYNIELSWPLDEPDVHGTVGKPQTGRNRISVQPVAPAKQEEKLGSINWFEDQLALRMPVSTPKRIRWQLAFLPYC